MRLGRAALDFELGQAVWGPAGLSGFPSAVPNDDEVGRVVPRSYWDHGTAGVGTTLIRYAAVTGDPGLRSWIGHAVGNVTRKYAVFPQLFHGLSGMGNFVLDVWEASGDPAYLAEAWQIAEGALLFRLERPEGVAFPGEQVLRESADLATGAAGVGLFLDRLLAADAGRRAGNFNFVVDELLEAGLSGDGLGLAEVVAAAAGDREQRLFRDAEVAGL
jgi:hypothetical protein